tara:strand:- start:1377 stop:2111 length:735 start_codon:yes stop_codon:yes gene_type:complete
MNPCQYAQYCNATHKQSKLYQFQKVKDQRKEEGKSKKDKDVVAKNAKKKEVERQAILRLKEAVRKVVKIQKELEYETTPFFGVTGRIWLWLLHLLAVCLWFLLNETWEEANAIDLPKAGGQDGMSLSPINGTGNSSVTGNTTGDAAEKQKQYMASNNALLAPFSHHMDMGGGDRTSASGGIGGFGMKADPYSEFDDTHFNETDDVYSGSDEELEQVLKTQDGGFAMFDAHGPLNTKASMKTGAF